MAAVYPLTKAHRITLARAFKGVPRVGMSIDCVIEEQMGGAFVDDVRHPTAFKIEVGPFFYFAGDAQGAGGRAFLEDIAPFTLFMPSSPGWIEEGRELHAERLVAIHRYSLSSARLSAEHLHRLCRESRFAGDVKRMDRSFAARIRGQDHFVDLSAFDSAEDFARRGIGFYLEKHDAVVGAAFSSLVCSRGIEVSVFVLEDYRRQGIATLLAGRLLAWCLEHGADANWDAANLESCRLAEKLGYVQKGRYLAHYLAD